MVGPPPLTGIKVLEFAGLAPGPFAGLIVADAGASVLRIDRPSPQPTPDALTRHKTSLAVDLKSPAGVALVHRLVAEADILIEPFRPGVMESLGLGPDALCALNPRLIYGRMTGFRRDGRYAKMAGHDINYLAVGGPLSMLGGSAARPTPPVNILGDFAGGGATLVQGLLMALFSRERSGVGQVVEANMVDGASYLATFPRLARKTPMGDRPRGENVLDGGCPYYDTYQTKDGGWMAVGALEPQFYRELIRGLGLEGKGWEERRMDRGCWGEMRSVFGAVFAGRTRKEWEGVFDGTDACCTPVLGYEELEAARTGHREGEQRPAVTLRGTPWLAVERGESGRDGIARGQGPGVEGDGFEGRFLTPGENGEGTLKEWLGWERGKQYEVGEGGGLVLKEKAKL